MNKNDPAGLHKFTSPLLAAVLALAMSLSLAAADRAYLITGLRPAAPGVELSLRDLQAESAGKPLTLVVYEKDRVIDLAAGEEISALRLGRGDILFVTGEGRSLRLMSITPGRPVHGGIAKSQPQEARVIDELSRRVAAEAGPVSAADVEADRVRRSFLFVLEFALGAPFTAAQERLIRGQLGPEWWAAKSDSEKKTFGQYPGVVAWILKAGQNDLEAMRKTLEATTRQWLQESPPSDPVVAMIRARLAERGRAVIAGDPPLTEMAASAFSELYAYARLLKRDGAALPGQLGDEAVAGARGELLRAWPGFSAAERGQVATAPGLWLVLRTLAVHGDAAQQEAARRKLLSIVAGDAPAGQAPAGTGGKGEQTVNAMLKHNVLMNIRQQTFNSYMWSRGFNYQPASGRMW
jgi:hypothetical protein